MPCLIAGQNVSLFSDQDLDFEALFKLIHANLGLNQLIQIEGDPKLHFLNACNVYIMP